MICNSDKQDAECLRRTLAGETEAFEELVVKYQRPVFNAICRMVADPEDAREISQNVFMKAFAHIDRFDPQRRFFSWLYRIAMNDAINFLASKHPAEPLAESYSSPAAGPDGDFEASETRRHVDEALTHLTPEYRAVVVLRHFLDCSYHEIAEVLELPEKTVKSRLFTARHALRDELTARGYGGRRATHA
jgi:RNA polymerase sigma-70 factor (ECF subfamily)